MPVNTLPPDLTDPGYATPAAGDDVTAEPSVTTAAASKPSKPLERGEPLGRYIILRVLGEGGMGIVYSAFDPELDRRVAIKLLRHSGNASPERQMRLMREAQALARISHPNVIAVYDVGTHNDNVFVAMELVESGTLTDWLEEKKRTPREIIAKLIDAGKGLGAAHAAGMIHRDFKPENVLVGKDGRCRVTDFGLARLTTTSGAGDHQPIGEADQQPTDTGKAINQRLTRAGAVVGTPLFMSWEQFQGRAADQRSDQYNFCASLYWALYGTPPPGPYTSGDSRDSTAETAAPASGNPWTPQRLRDLPKEPRLPAPVRKAILRGLSLKPDDRFPTMEDLLRELGKDPRVAQRRWAIAGAAVLVLALGAATYVPVLQQSRQLCRGADRKLEGVWTSDIREKTKAAFASVSPQFGADAADRSAAVLDRYTAAWAEMHKDACEATRIRGEQSDQVLALRMICLDRRLQQIGALSKLFLSPDAKIVDKALDAANALPPIENCADLDALTSPVPRPEDPAEQASLVRLERSVAEVRALNDAARFRQALELVVSILKESDKRPWPPMQAELMELKGWLTFRSGDAPAAERMLREALIWAERGRYDSQKPRILSKLVLLAGSDKRYEEALYWGQLGEAVASRRNDAMAGVELGVRLGQVYMQKGDNETARVTLERAAVLCDRSLGRDHPYMGLTLSALAEAYSGTGDYQRALELLQTSLGITERTRGPNHPNAGVAHSTLAYALYRLGDYDKAHDHIQSAIKIFTAAYGPENLEVSTALDTLATILHLDGLDAESLVEAHRALAIKTKALERDDPDLSYSMVNVGKALLGLRRYPEALGYLERAHAMQQAAKLPSEEIAEARFAYAQALWEVKKDRSRALVLAVQAREGFRRGYDRRGEDEAERWLAAHGGGPTAARP